MPALKSPKLLLATYTVAIFLSAALLFAVQPLFAKMVLPRLGGSPAVWSVAMVFFQAVLLGGYAYAHLLTRVVPGRFSVIIHIVVMLIATLALPLSIAAGWGRPPQAWEELWLLGLFGASIGLPFFALSANGPLLQAWFARTDHPAAGDPYFLYAASNVGSFLALISYPFLVEPFTRLGQQTSAWSIGFYLLILLIGACGVWLVRSRNALPAVESDTGAAPTRRDALIWVALAAVPSALLIAVTAHVSTDVAASPFLWVIPLALYLATFVIVFQTRPVLPHWLMTWLQPLAVILLVVWLAISPSDEAFLAIAVNILGFFVLALVCHGELAHRRPPARYLTAFYLWLSLGGVIGGIFAGMIAMHVFSWVAEYPLLIVAAALCRPGLKFARAPLDLVFWLALLVAAAAMVYGAQSVGYEFTEKAFNYWVAAMMALSLVFYRDVLKFSGVIALAFFFNVLFGSDSGNRDFVRSFFGVHKVLESDSGQFRILKHGTIEHGAQRIRDAHGKPVSGRPEVLTYYHAQSPLAQGIAAMRERKGVVRLAVVGLGTGSLACQTLPGDTLHIYEIDRAVVRIARDPKRFTYLSNCAPDPTIIVGDARLTLADAKDGQYDVLVIDAFSSDAIPTHLLTQEAMAIYIRKMAPDGIVLVHVSNKHMALAPVVAGIAHANDLVARQNESEEGVDDSNHKFGSTVVAVARRDEDFGSLAKSENWTEAEPDEDDWVWTDDYSNVIGAMIRQLRKDD